MLDLLKVAVANHIEASLVVHSYHWNVTGINFTEYHALFDEIYSDYQDQVDTLAEYIRILSDAKEYVNASVEIVRLNTTIKSVIVVDDAEKMVVEIIKINSEILDGFKELFKKSTDEGLRNYCADRINVGSKLNWKLVAITK
jgi:starvation-inducible DNA-binding protein